MTTLLGSAPLGAWSRPRVTVRGDGVFSAEVPIEGDGPYLTDHFPEQRVFPGVLLLETAFRAACSAVSAPTARLAAVHSLRLLLPLAPGDTAHLDGHVDGRRVSVVVSRDDGRVAARMQFGLGDDDGDSDDGAPAGPAAEAPPVPEAGGAGALDRRAVSRILPHGPGMTLVHWVEELIPGRRVLARRTVSSAEPCIAGDVAGAQDGREPEFPASLLLEAFGQSAALLWLGGGGRERAPGEVLMFVSARGCTFTRPARPGDLVRLDARLEHAGPGAAFVSGSAWVGSHRIAGFEWLGAVVRPSAELALTASPARRPEVTPSERSAVHD